MRRKSIEQMLDDRIDEEGGPLVYVFESEQMQNTPPWIPLAGNFTCL
ncbi:MAG TPA: hypothetical protein VKB88_40260 [Bryobacteraceae bacterium]|nr:hypothetical protein [Bryobacteraceae bacterium]